MSDVNGYKLAPVLLQYPTAALFDELDAFAASTSPKPAREAFSRFLTWLRATPPTEVAQHYVETFGLRRHCALYLTYYCYDDTRKRGMSMVIFKTAYHDAGFAPCEDELPDNLPMVLDFTALTPRGQRLLHATGPTSHCCAARSTKSTPPTRTWSRPSAPSYRNWGVTRSAKYSKHGTPAHRVRMSASNRSPHRSTSPATGTTT